MRGEPTELMDDAELLQRWCDIASNPDELGTWPPELRARAIELKRNATPHVGATIERLRREQSKQDNGNDSGMVRLQCGADVAPEAIRWLWTNNIARGKFHLIAGAVGAGKTTLALAVLATLTRRGGRWPDGTLVDEPVNGLIWSGEDDVADTLIPRLLAMGADMSRVYFVGDVLVDGKARPFDPARDMQSLEMEARRIGDVGLLIVDPVVQAVAGDSHKNTEVRRSLQPLTDLARRLDAAALGISHFSKGSAGRDPVERVTGSVAFGALPRIVFAAAKTTDDAGKVTRIFVRAKSNIGPDGGGFTFDLEQVDLPGHDGITGSRVLWTGGIEGTARDLLAAAEMTDNPEDRGATDEATDWLRDMLVDGAMKAADVQKQARIAGISDKGLRRAREKLGIRPKKQDFTGGWIWSLPTKMPEGVHTKTLGTLGTLGTFEDAHTPTKTSQDAQDALKTGGGREGTFGGKCPKCAGEGCAWCAAEAGR
jgi:putative DNA primase/helicase